MISSEPKLAELILRETPWPRHTKTIRLRNKDDVPTTLAFHPFREAYETPLSLYYIQGFVYENGFPVATALRSPPPHPPPSPVIQKQSIKNATSINRIPGHHCFPRSVMCIIVVLPGRSLTNKYQSRRSPRETPSENERVRQVRQPSCSGSVKSHPTIVPYC